MSREHVQPVDYPSPPREVSMVEPVPSYVQTAVYLYCLLVAVVGVSLHVWIRTDWTRSHPRGTATEELSARK